MCRTRRESGTLIHLLGSYSCARVTHLTSAFHLSCRVFVCFNDLWTRLYSFNCATFHQVQRLCFQEREENMWTSINTLYPPRPYTQKLSIPIGILYPHLDLFYLYQSVMCRIVIMNIVVYHHQCPAFAWGMIYCDQCVINCNSCTFT